MAGLSLRLSSFALAGLFFLPISGSSLDWQYAVYHTPERIIYYFDYQLGPDAGKWRCELVERYAEFF